MVNPFIGFHGDQPVVDRHLSELGALPAHVLHASLVCVVLFRGVRLQQATFGDGEYNA